MQKKAQERKASRWWVNIQTELKASMPLLLTTQHKLALCKSYHCHRSAR